MSIGTWLGVGAVAITAAVAGFALGVMAGIAALGWGGRSKTDRELLEEYQPAVWGRSWTMARWTHGSKDRVGSRP